MEEQFDLSWNNRKVRMLCYIMIPIALINIVFTLTTNNPIPPILHFSPTIGWILYGIWRYFLKAIKKALKKEVVLSNAFSISTENHIFTVFESIIVGISFIFITFKSPKKQTYYSNH